ncbi:hypothetical protein ASZ90_009243 [hydrocarbon metagenome]|uniref:Uncharacterized protein n=1 Tax=hydrocarbon metagenome TaxID=938273 RepID=A0A0W8FJL2_9ZZZZ
MALQVRRYQKRAGCLAVCWCTGLEIDEPVVEILQSSRWL